MYESVVAQELRAHGHKLFYYDNRKQGEVDYLVDDHLKKLLRSIDEIKRPFASKESSINGEQASDVLSECKDNGFSLKKQHISIKKGKKKKFSYFLALFMHFTTIDNYTQK